jgi:predicted RNase H-like HicB family nuclease
MSTIRTFTLTIHNEGGHIWAEVKELPGCFASGRDMDELKDALIEAIGMCLTSESVAGVELEEPPPPAVKQIRARAELVPC